MNLRWRARLVIGSGLLVLASSFLPWWVLRIRVGWGDGTHYVTHYGSAWRMSSRWSAAVLVTVAAVAVWLIWRLVRARVPVVVWLVGLAAIALSVFLTVDQWRDVEALPRPGSTTTLKGTISAGKTASESDPFVDAWMSRDHLRSYHHPDLYADVTWGLWIGLGGMLLVGASLVAAGSGRARPSSMPSRSPSTDPPENGPAPRSP